MATLNPILDIEVAATYADYWGGQDRDEIKDPTERLQYEFRNLADAQRLWINTSSTQIKELADKMREANSLSQLINSALGTIKDTATTYEFVKNVSREDAQKFIDRLGAAGGVIWDPVAGAYKPLIMQEDPNHVGPPKMWRVVGNKESIGKVAENLQLSVTNYNGLSQQMQLVFTNVNNRYTESMNFISAGTDKEAKQEQTIVTNFAGR